MQEISYEDFSVWIEPGPEGKSYRVDARCRAGEGSSQFEWDSVLAEISRFSFTEAAPVRPPKRLPTSTRHAKPPTESNSPALKPREIGEILFRRLFSGPVRQLHDRLCGSHSGPRRGVRLKLHLDPGRSGALCTLPWELLYDSDTKDYLGLGRLTPLVRYLELQRPTTPVPFNPPLQVLLAPANTPGGNILDLAEERRLIRQSLAEGSIEPEVLGRTHLEELRNELIRSTYHILHFMGHGIFDEQSGTGSLLLESVEGGEEIISGEVLANHLKGCLPQLVVVNACDSGRVASSEGADFFAGVASSLVMAGVPAVVAMRTPITDHAAIAFSKALYRELAAGAPVDAAVTEGRLAIYRLDPFSAEWAIPVLFMRVPDGQLFATGKKLEDHSSFPGKGGQISQHKAADAPNIGTVHGSQVIIAHEVREINFQKLSD